MARVDRLIDKGQSQAAGMNDLGSDITAGSPFSADQIAQASTALEATKNRLQVAKDSQHSLTKEVAAKAKELRDAVARNVSFFQGKLGKKDPRLPKLGGRVLVHRGGRARKDASAEPKPE